MLFVRVSLLFSIAMLICRFCVQRFVVESYVVIYCRRSLHSESHCHEKLPLRYLIDCLFIILVMRV